MEPEEYYYAATKAWDAGDLETAFKLYLKGSELGDISSQYNLGIFYDVGYGTKPDRNKALYWYKYVWKKEKDSGMCTNIASLYAAENNYRQAVFWWRRAIKMDDGEAALELGTYLLKRDRQKNLKKSHLLFKQAAKSKHITPFGREEACSHIALIYASMNNHRQALFWWDKAINLGSIDSILALAIYLNDRNKARNRQEVLDLLKEVIECQYTEDETREKANQVLRELGEEV